MPTIEQIRAARALLGWSQKDLADHAGLSQTGIARIENGTHQPNTATLEKITKAFDAADIEFQGTTGLRKRLGEIKIYRGRDGFRTFMDDVYMTARDYGGEICLFNSKPALWYKWLGEEWYEMHAGRMSKLDNISVRITVREGEDFFILGSAEHRWFPESMREEKIFYAYGPKLGFLDFREDDIRITVLNQPEFTDSFRILFNIAWEQVAMPLPVKNN